MNRQRTEHQLPLQFEIFGYQLEITVIFNYWPGLPATPASYASGGEPAEPAEIEITGIETDSERQLPDWQLELLWDELYENYMGEMLAEAEGD